MTFEILDNRQGQWEADNTKECKYFVRSLQTGYLIALALKHLQRKL